MCLVRGRPASGGVGRGLRSVLANGVEHAAIGQRVGAFIARVACSIS
jgi:hypothetical protein